MRAKARWINNERGIDVVDITDNWIAWESLPKASVWLVGNLESRKKIQLRFGSLRDYEKKWGQRLDQWEAAGVTLPRGTGAGNNAAKAVIAQESAGCSCPNMSRQQINCMKYEPTHREQQLPFTHTHTHTFGMYESLAMCITMSHHIWRKYFMFILMSLNQDEDDYARDTEIKAEVKILLNE